MKWKTICCLLLFFANFSPFNPYFYDYIFFSVKHIYLPSLKILYQPNGGDLRVPPRRSNIFVHCHVCCTHHWVAKQVNKVSPHYTFSILPLKPWRASHRFDLRFFFLLPGRLWHDFGLKCLIDWPGIWRALYHFTVKNHMIQQSRLLDNEHLCKLYHHNRN